MRIMARSMMETDMESLEKMLKKLREEAETNIEPYNDQTPYSLGNILQEATKSFEE
jgi:hypothetical protein